MNIRNEIYFSREGRLPRVQFFLYLLFLLVIIFIVKSLLKQIFPDMVGLILSTLLRLAALFFMFPALIYKRQHDRNSDGKKKVRGLLILLTLIFLSSFFLNLLSSLNLPSSSLSQVASLLKTDKIQVDQLVQQMKVTTTTGEQQQIYKQMLTIENKALSEAFAPLHITILVVVFAYFLFLIWSVILLIPLLFMPGTKGSNTYGPDLVRKQF